MAKKNSLLLVIRIILIIDVIIIVTSVILSHQPGNVPYWSFTVSDFIQLLVVEIALLGPMYFEYWKKQQDRASIGFVEVYAPDIVEDVNSDPYAKVYCVKIKNNSDVLLKNCKVLLSEIKVKEKDQRNKNKVFASKKINRYLCWHSVNTNTKNLNPSEPASVMLGKLENKQVLLSGFRPTSHFFELFYFSDKDQRDISSELIHRNSLLCMEFYSENADVFSLDIKLSWPEDVKSEEELANKLQLEFYNQSN